MGSVLIYDGECGFCTTAAQWIHSRWPHPDHRIVPWQFLNEPELTAMGLTKETASLRAYWWDSDRLFGGERAIARALREARYPWRLLGVFLDLPVVRLLARPGYLLVVRFRYRLPGATPTCRL